MEQEKNITQTEEKEIMSKIGRKFLGVFPPVTNFDKKMLKSYLKGYETFTYGRNKYQEPITHQVKQEYYIKETNGE